MIEATNRYCPECGQGRLSWNKDKGEVTCRNCGLVIDDKLVDFGQDWREFDGNDQTKRRSGAPLTYLQPGISTEIGTKSEIYKLKGRSKDKYFRLRTWQRRVSTSIEHNLSQALSEIKRVASILKLPSMVEEEGARIYTQALHKGLIKGRGIERMVAGAIHASCRQNEIPKTLEEISNATGIEKKEVGRAYRFITRELCLKVLPVSPVSFIPKFASFLKLTPKTQTKAIKLIERAQKQKLTSGRSPNSVAAAALYAAALINKERRIQSDISNVANITEVTLRNRFQELVRELKLKKQVKKK